MTAKPEPTSDEDREAYRKARLRANFKAWYYRKKEERMKRAADGNDLPGSDSPFSNLWSPPAPAVPLLARGRAVRVACSEGHRFIARALPEACPERACKGVMRIE